MCVCVFVSVCLCLCVCVFVSVCLFTPSCLQHTKNMSHWQIVKRGKEDKSGRGENVENRHGGNSKNCYVAMHKTRSEDWDGQPDSDFAKLRNFAVNHSTFIHSTIHRTPKRISPPMWQLGQSMISTNEKDGYLIISSVIER